MRHDDVIVKIFHSISNVNRVLTFIVELCCGMRHIYNIMYSHMRRKYRSIITNTHARTRTFIIALPVHLK